MLIHKLWRLRLKKLKEVRSFTATKWRLKKMAKIKRLKKEISILTKTATSPLNKKSLNTSIEIQKKRNRKSKKNNQLWRPRSK